MSTDISLNSVLYPFKEVTKFIISKKDVPVGLIFFIKNSPCFLLKTLKNANAFNPHPRSFLPNKAPPVSFYLLKRLSDTQFRNTANFSDIFIFVNINIFN
tara:strand:+ start:942 stop:1241 length:300 start_codon:yes stop_codon:yes gene_type:complete